MAARKPRRWQLLALGAAALALAGLHGVAPSPGADDAAAAPDAPARPAGRTRPEPRAAAATETLQVARLDAPRGDAPAVDERAAARVFAPHSWQPPAAPPARAARAAPPEPPKAPPFPYAYFGGLTDGPERTAFFLAGNRVIALRRGDQVASFRVDALDTQQMTLTYLPLSETVTVPLGSTP